MHALVVTLLLAAPLTGAPMRGLLEDSSAEGRATRDRCIGAGAAGAAGMALGAVVGGGIALGLTEIVRVSDPNNTSASKNFGAFAIPAGVIAGGVAGLAAGTIGAWELGAELAGKAPVTR